MPQAWFEPTNPMSEQSKDHIHHKRDFLP